MQREPQFGESAGDIFFAWVLAIPIFIGPGIFLFQVVGWLKSGQWPPVPLSRAFDYFGVDQPKTTWIGAQKAIDFILDLPLVVLEGARTSNKS